MSSLSEIAISSSIRGFDPIRGFNATAVARRATLLLLTLRLTGGR
jgi:hypothetical protein